MRERLHAILHTVGVVVLCGASACGGDASGGGGQTLEPAEGIFAALGEPMPRATPEQLEAFERGREVALRRFTPEDGLGPVFNVTFCGACHETPTIGGSAPRYRDFYLQASVLADGSYITPSLGGILHAYGIGEEPERPVHDESYEIVGRRNGIPFFGVGLIAALDEAAILIHADPDDADGDGISGRPNYEDGFVGRFGRKAQTTSLEGFIRGPINNHAGITSDPLTDGQRARLPVPSNLESVVDDALRGTDGALRFSGHGQAAAPSSPLTDLDAIADPEMASEDLFDLVSFVMLLAAPLPDAPTPESEQGRELFAEIGCEGCHVEMLEGPDGGVPLWSDLLLHDMGPAMSDGLQMGLAEGSEFRTQPLWGIAATGPYLHDGRADTLDEAIGWHGGEAERSREAFFALSDRERSDVIAFLESLGGLSQRSGGLVPPNEPMPAVGAYGGPDRELAGDEVELWYEGRRLFDDNIAVSEGLGPLFNGDSCRACHFDPVVGGAGPLGVNVMRYGTHDPVTAEFNIPPGGTIVAKFGNPGLLRPEPTSAHNVLEPRQTPGVFGLGGIESIPDEIILGLADPDDADGDGISGRAHRLADGSLGRMGWKAQVPSVRDFVRDAASAELGLTVPEDPNSLFGATADDDPMPDPDFPQASVEALAFYIASLSAPPAGDLDARGEALFIEVGCASCHVPALPGAGGDIPLYSDLLLHDVAPDSYIGIPDGDATGREFRTPPLWGLSTSGPYMHDGSATTVRDAIEAHHAEGQASADAFAALSADDQSALLRMLQAL